MENENWNFLNKYIFVDFGFEIYVSLFYGLQCVSVLNILLPKHKKHGFNTKTCPCYINLLIILLPNIKNIIFLIKTVFLIFCNLLKLQKYMFLY